MEYGFLAAAAALAVVCIRQGRRLRRVEEQLAAQGKTLAAAEERMEEHTLWEREAAKSERLFREGLQNILNYGVK